MFTTRDTGLHLTARTAHGITPVPSRGIPRLTSLSGNPTSSPGLISLA